MIFRRGSDAESNPELVGSTEKVGNKRSVKPGDALNDAGNVTPVSTTQETQTPSLLEIRREDRDVTDDLVRRVLTAIDEWARINGLNALPRRIIFQQALSILNAVDRNFPSEK